MKRRIPVIIGMIAALSMVLAACGNDDTPGAQGTPTAEACKPYKKATALGLQGGSVSMAGGDPYALNPQAKPVVKVGFIGDLTGEDLARSSFTPRDAAKLAFKLANAKGDLPVTIEMVITRQQGR